MLIRRGAGALLDEMGLRKPRQERHRGFPVWHSDHAGRRRRPGRDARNHTREQALTEVQDAGTELQTAELGRTSPGAMATGTTT